MTSLPISYRPYCTSNERPRIPSGDCTNNTCYSVICGTAASNYKACFAKASNVAKGSTDPRRSATADFKADLEPPAAATISATEQSAKTADSTASN